MFFSRRQLLVTAISSAPVVLAVAVADPAAAATASAPPALAATIEPGEVTTLSFPSADFAKRRSVAYSLSEQVRLSRPSAFRVVVEYDSRLFSAMESVVVSHGDHYESCPTERSQQQPPNRSSVSYSVPDLSDGDSSPLLCVGVPLTTRDAYPEENIDAPLPISVTIQDEAGAVLASVEWSADEAPAAAAAWGVELDASWGTVGGPDSRSTYRVPRSIRCTSVGPAAVPAGSVLTVDLDARVIAACSVAGVTPVPAQLQGDDGSGRPNALVPWDSSALDVAESATGERRTLRITLNRAIDAGASLDVAVSTSPANPVPTVASVVYASAVFSGPAGARATGRYGVTDLTCSGSPQVGGVTTGTV
ncbi:hypothetical protein C5D07_04525 [Rathayibacter tritici]|uniref:hypothetical protein n=1 Tax=Rathayibacter tritici TaxID=33888 RepID=UPI000CE74E54|nr:hypothetical protein [Rathayibacter tritici]PPF24654.1 hypothetical protein C5C06_12895 [Rathayibacter tritici]PPI17649.1 hypothetical protein C5D07_04525 [Rathayibacter tritici]